MFFSARFSKLHDALDRGAKPGQKLPQKQKTDPSEVVERKKKYEDTKRTRKFLPLWKNERPWLMYSEEISLCFAPIVKIRGKMVVLLAGVTTSVWIL
jgi:hypothetical protein